jgi:hypothetical protein
MPNNGIHIDDLTAEQRRELGLTKPRQSKFTAEEMRARALRVLASIADLSRAERDRVLKHAGKVNRV